MVNVEKYYSRAFELYKTLHENAEVGFDLPETVKIVKKELDACKIKYTEKYGKGSIVAEIGSGEKIIALRADMDALPIEEQSGVPFTSKNKGVMHACGHDSHTAILLAVARYLKENEDRLRVKVRLIFQPSEECAISGAKMLVDNGVMDGVDQIICTHCENEIDFGQIGVCVGNYMAACVPLKIIFYGKSSHAALPKHGIDAIAMTNDAYIELKKYVKENFADEDYIWSVGRFSGGTAHNVICDKCEMDISFRFFDVERSKIVENGVKNICEDIAKRYGGKTEVMWEMSTGPVINDSKIIDRIRNIANKNSIKINEVKKRMSSEDFGWYLQKSKGAIFRYGTKNDEYGCNTVAHTSNFKIYPEGMKTAITLFCDYVLSL
ncbi:MAG: amidohydrolase [Clostridia bacterium]|nr:amidohydrolase [Clostridia bacterium]